MSEFTVWSALNYKGTKREFDTCGVHNMPFAIKSYLWVGLGQTGNMYNALNAGGVVEWTFPSSGTEQSPRADGWKSILIVC